MTRTGRHFGVIVERAFLRPGIHGVMIDNHLVILDTGADAYLCLPEVGPLELNDRQVLATPEVLQALEAEGLIADRLMSSNYPTRPIPPPPTRPCRPATSRPLRLGTAASFAGSWLGMAAQRPGIADLALRCGRRRATTGDPERLDQRVDAFRRLAPAMPWVGECLFQSWLLLAFLQRAGLDATWVFGVRLRPFAAHCWLQTEDMALTDAPEALLSYRPILAI